MFLLDLLVAWPEIANVFAAYPRVAMPMDPEMVWHFGVEASNLGVGSCEAIAIYWNGQYLANGYPVWKNMEECSQILFSSGYNY